MCFGFCDSDNMNSNTSWQPSQNNGGFLQQQEINGGLSSSVITQPSYGGGFVQIQEIQSSGGISSIMTSHQSNGFGVGGGGGGLTSTTYNQNTF